MSNDLLDTGNALLTPIEEALRPSLAPFALHAHSNVNDHVLAIGERYMALITLGGTLRTEIELPQDVVVTEPVIGDFDDDGLNDIIVVTTKGFYGYRTHRRLAGQLFSFLVLGLLILLGGVFAFKLAHSNTLQKVVQRSSQLGQQHANGMKGRTTFTGGLRQVGFKSTKAQL